MQKRAFSSDFPTEFDSLKFKENKSIFFDQNDIPLPISAIDSLHYHQRFEIGICLDGTGLFYNSFKTEVINPGDIVFFFPGVAHYSQSISKHSPCHCRFAFLDSQQLLFALFNENITHANLISEAQYYDIPLIIRQTEFPHIHLILSSLLKDIFDDTEHQLLLTAIHFTEFLLKIPLNFSKLPSHPSIDKKTDNDILLTEAFINSHYTEPLSIDLLCKVSHLSASQLRRKFKKQFGVSPFAYLHNLRCNVASQLLIHTNLPVSKITQKIGYLDSSEFYKHFLQTYGISPSSFRKKRKPANNTKNC